MVVNIQSRAPAHGAGWLCNKVVVDRSRLAATSDSCYFRVIAEPLLHNSILQISLLPSLKNSRSSSIADDLIGAITVTGLFFALLQLPIVAADNSHDLGSQAAYAYWTLHGFSYGKDVSQNVGPLGFLAYPDVS